MLVEDQVPYPERGVQGAGEAGEEDAFDLGVEGGEPAGADADDAEGWSVVGGAEATGSEGLGDGVRFELKGSQDEQFTGLDGRRIVQQMGVPLAQMYTVAKYVLSQRLRGRKRYPLVLMLEPLFRCNLACAGCGKIQYPAAVLRRQLTPEECFQAADECGAPIVSIPGGEPLLHPQIDRIVAGLVARRKYVYLCTNALLLKKKLELFTPTKFLSFSVHMDGPREHHDACVSRAGTYDIALDAMKVAIARGFRVTTNTTLFEGADPVGLRGFFDEMMAIGVEGMMLSPGYSYEKAPDQDHFLKRDRTRALFRRLLGNGRKTWRFNQSSLFLEFLMGKREYACTPWGMPTYNIFGWQRPCYLLQEGYARTFAELMRSTAWERYGAESGNPRCADCMVHSGYEASAVDDTFGSIRGLFAAARAALFGSTCRDDGALAGIERRSAGPFVPLTVRGRTGDSRASR